MTNDIIITDHLTIPHGEVRFKFARSGGPGGQNVNKVETRVELLFDVANSPSLADDARQKIVSHLGNRMTDDGVLHIIAGESRSQWKNREAATARIVELLAHALKPRKKRKKTKAPHASRQKRLDDKKRRGEIKKMRRI